MNSSDYTILNNIEFWPMTVGRSVDWSAAASSRVFVHGFSGKMGISRICQEDFSVGGYGVLACGHVMHQECCSTYVNHQRGQAPNCLPECPLCKATFEGCVCICV